MGMQEHGRSVSIRSRAVWLATLLGVTLAWAATGHCQQDLIAEVQVSGAGYVSADVVLDAVRDILKPGSPVTAEALQAAQKAVAALGYYERVVISQRIVPQGIQVIITVVEKRRVERVLFVGNTALSDEKLASVIKSKVGGLVDPRLAERDAARIQEAYTEAGYLARVAPVEVDNFGVLTFLVEETRIEDIRITGLKKTKPWVARRQLNLKKGELYQDKRVSQNMRRLYDLQIFSDVTFDLLPGVADPLKGVIVEFKIKEDRTARAEGAVAYSSLDNLVVMLSIQERNFRGQAERVSASMELFGRTSFDVDYYEPFWDAKGTSVEMSLFDTERRRQFVGGAAFATQDDRFDERRTGGSVRFSRPLREDYRTRLSLRLRSEKVSSSQSQALRAVTPQGVSSAAQDYYDDKDAPPDNPNLDPDNPDPGDIIGPVVVAAPLHPGQRLTSVTLGYTRDMRDSTTNTREGNYTTVSGEVAGGLFGGETDFQKFSVEHRRYYPVTDKDVVAMRAMAGFTLGDLPLYESFSLGGANTLRGYEEDRFRGENVLLVGAEYRHPITDSLSVVGFVDAGSAYGGEFPTVVPGFNIPAEDSSLSMHIGAGVGLRVVTPMGPLRLDFGWGDDGSQAHFSFMQAY